MTLVSGDPKASGTVAKTANLFTVAAALMAVLAGVPAARAATIPVTIFAINDLHGNLLPPEGGLSWPIPKIPKRKSRLPRAGVEYMATLIKQTARPAIPIPFSWRRAM